MYFVYFLKSQKNGKFYTGFTSRHPEERLKEHNYGQNKWASQNGPFELLYYETYHCGEDAQKREKFYKTGIGRKIRNAIIVTITGQ